MLGVSGQQYKLVPEEHFRASRLHERQKEMEHEREAGIIKVDDIVILGGPSLPLA